MKTYGYVFGLSFILLLGMGAGCGQKGVEGDTTSWLPSEEILTGDSSGNMHILVKDDTLDTEEEMQDTSANVETSTPSSCDAAFICDLGQTCSSGVCVDDPAITGTKPFVYTHPTHGYTITFPAAWDGAVVSLSKGLYSEEVGEIDRTFFGFPEQPELFIIGVYTEAQWSLIEALGHGSSPMKLFEQDEKVFAGTIAQSTTNEEMALRWTEAEQILFSLKQ